MDNGTRILLIGKKEENDKMIVQLFNSDNESLARAVGKSVDELMRNIVHKFENVIIQKKPLITNGYRISESTGNYIPCKKLPIEVEKRATDFILN